MADSLPQPGVTVPADGWETNAYRIDARLRPVTDWLLERSGVRAGDVVLDVAAGPGGVGHRAAELTGSHGRVLSTDLAAAMVDAARRVGAQRGLTNVEYQVMDAQAMDLKDDAVDVVVCRSGFMLMPDPVAALREVRRVLRPGGNLAFSVFAAPEQNPFVRVPQQVLAELGHGPPPPRGAPGVFAMSDPVRIRDLLTGASFTVEAIEAIDLEGPHPSVDSIVDRILEMNAQVGPIHRSLPEPERAALRQALADGFDAFRKADGTYVLAAQMWGAHAR